MTQRPARTVGAGTGRALVGPTGPGTNLGKLDFVTRPVPDFSVPETFASASSPAPPAPRTERPGARPRRWGRWLLGALVLMAALGGLALRLLDPWLRQKLERQVTAQTHGQYCLHVGALRTSLWQRAVRLRGVRLRPAAQVADTLPRVRLDVARLHLTGIGLWALVRRGVVPLDSVVLDSIRLDVLALARRPARHAGQPLAERLPLHLQGVRIGYLSVLRAQADYRPNPEATAYVRRADLSGHDLLISPAGAADSQRLAFAAAWQLRLGRVRGRAAGHRVALAGLLAATTSRVVQLDSLTVRPDGPARPGAARVTALLPRLRLTGLDAAAVQHHRRFRADSLLLGRPQFAVVLPSGQAPGAAPMGPAYLQQFDLAHVVVRQGAGRVVSPGGTHGAVRGIEVAGTALHYAAGAAPDARRVFLARAWDVALGPGAATVAAHAATLGGLRLSSAAGTFELRAVRVRPPAPGRGRPGGVRIDLALPRLALSGLDAAALTQQRRFQATALDIDRPRLDFTPPAQPPSPVWKLLAPVLRRADLAQVRVRHAEVRISGLRHRPEVHDVSLTGRAIRIDSLAARAPGRIAYARAWRAHSGLVAAPFDPPYYRATSQHAQLDTDARTFRFDDLALTPKYSAMGTNLHKGYQAPAVRIRVASLAASGLDFAALARDKDLRIGRVVAQRPVVHIDSDGRGPINPNQSKISPEEMIHLPMTVDVRRLDIVGGNLYSSYRSPLTPIPGTLSINRFTGTFRNLSNDPRRQTAASPLTGRATTYLQNRVRLDARVAMYLLDPQGRHRVWGTFGAGPFGILNSMTVPTRLVEFRKGDVQRIRFDMQASRKGTTGTMRAEYTGLQLKLLSYQQAEVKPSLLKNIVSKAANVLVIRDQNPRKRGELVTGAMTSTREPRFSVFTLWRQGIVSGLFNNMGIPQKLAQKLSESKDEAPLPK